MTLVYVYSYKCGSTRHGIGPGRAGFGASNTRPGSGIVIQRLARPKPGQNAVGPGFSPTRMATRS